MNLKIEGCVHVLDSIVLKVSLLLIMNQMDVSLEEDAKDILSE